MARTLLSFALLVVATASPPALQAHARPQIADRPPPFRIYDVGRRERNMGRLLAQLAGTPSLSHQAADAALGRLDAIRREQARLETQNGGRLNPSILRIIDARLNALSRQTGLREPAS